MTKQLIVANFKSNKTEFEAKNWLESFLQIKNSAPVLINKEIIICPPFTLLSLFKSFIKQHNLGIKLGAQNVSEFDEGAYTGEINAKQIKEFADYVLIGHSERRRYFQETDLVLAEKTKLALVSNLTPIFLVQSEETLIPNGIQIVAYEPVFAIGSGMPDSPENAEKIASIIKNKGVECVLYGGSVNSANVKNFIVKSNISGVLVGGASLEAEEFIQIIKNA